MPFSLSVQFEQWITAQKLGIFKFLFLFHFVIVFYIRSSRPLPARSLFLVVLHNAVKNIHVRKAWFVTCYRNREYAKNIYFLEIYIWKRVFFTCLHLHCFSRNLSFLLILTLSVPTPQNVETNEIVLPLPTNCFSVFDHFVGVGV